MAGGSGFECSNLTQPALVEPDDAAVPPANPRLLLTPLQFGQRYFSRPIDTDIVWGELAPYMLWIGSNWMTWSSVYPNNSFIVRSVPIALINNGGTFYPREYWLVLKQGENLVMYDIAQDVVSRSLIERTLNELPYTDSNGDRAALAALGADRFQGYNGEVANSAPDIMQFIIIWSQGDTPEPIVVDARHEMSERDQVPNLVTSVQHYATNGWGMSSFGEDFGNVKDLLRRPIHC